MLKQEYLGALREFKGQRMPNVVLVLVDCLRARNIGCYGYGVEDTPYMDRLAEGSFLFRKAFVQAPHTQPSIASILTSLYPSVHGVNKRENRFDARMIRMGEVLREAGYDTAAFVANPHINPKSGHLEGIQFFTDGCNWIKRRSWRLSRWGEDSSVLNGYFFNWFRRKRTPNQPFFAFIFYIDVHNPYTSLPNVFRRFLNTKLHYPDFTKNEYSDDEMEQLEQLHRKQVRKVDRSVGRLIRFLERQKAWDNTLLILTADHGEGLDRRPGHGSHGGLYEKGIHVPLIMSAPWLKAFPRMFDHLVASIDILPSILELLGLPECPQCQGRSFTPLLRGDAYEPREYVAGEYNRNRYIRTGRWKYINNTGGILGPHPDWSNHRELLEFEELYDLEVDADEDRNVVRQVSEDLLARLRSLHHRFLGILQEQTFCAETYKMDEDVLQRLRGLGYIE